VRFSTTALNEDKTTAVKEKKKKEKEKKREKKERKKKRKKKKKKRITEYPAGMHNNDVARKHTERERGGGGERRGIRERGTPRRGGRAARADK